MWQSACLPPEQGVSVCSCYSSCASCWRARSLPALGQTHILVCGQRESLDLGSPRDYLVSVHSAACREESGDVSGCSG